MAHATFRGCEKRVLESIAFLGSCTRPELRKYIAGGKSPISENGIKNGTQVCLHHQYATETDGVLSLTEKGKIKLAEQQGRRKVNPVQ